MIEAVAQDGLLAYTLPPQTREKLHFIEREIHIFCTAMKSKRTLVYADLMSGPGISVDTLTGEERRGTALLATQRPEFSRLFINDANGMVTDALRARLLDEPESRLMIRTDDCNAAVEAARAFLFPTKSWQTLGLAVIDPSAYQMHFASIARLTEGVHMDLVIVLMTSFMRRFLDTPSFAAPLSRILGDEQVAELIRRRKRGDQLRFGDFLSCFRSQLSSIGYHYVHDVPALNSVRTVVYHVVTASRHPLGRKFSERAGARCSTGQITLPLIFQRDEHD